LGTILKTQRLKVPPHQREYRWTTHVQKLFEDLERALNSDREYFLGTIVTIVDTDGTLEVIDGQQRLATITILLSQIQRYLQAIDPELASSIDGFLREYDRSHKEWVPKLRLNLVDRDFFGKMLSATPPYPELPSSAPISHKRIRNAFITAQQYVRTIVAVQSNRNVHGDLLTKWIDFIEADAEAILFRVPTGSNAYKMFETLNDRGLKTSQADLVKCYLFGRAEERYPEAQSCWSVMSGSLSSLQGDDEDRDDDKEDITVVFLRTALMAIQGFLTRGEVFSVVEGIGQGPQSVISVMNEFEELSRVYEATFFQDHERWKKCPDGMRHSIETINDFDIKPFRPALLAVAARFAPAEAAKAFQLFVALGVRMLITTSTRTGSVEQSFAAVARKIFKDRTITTAAELRKEIASLIPSDAQFYQAFQTATVTSGPLARYYLRALEKAAKAEPFAWWVPIADKEAMTLEHILPLRPEGGWSQFSEDEVKAYSKRIGNLCLLPKALNADLGNAEQATKYAVYRDAPYRLTHSVSEFPQWNVDAICRRQEVLAKLAVEAWPV